MKTSIQLIEKIIRAKTALHLKLVAHRNGHKVDIGGGRIDELIAEVDAGLLRYERMLVLFKNEMAAAAMESAETDAECNSELVEGYAQAAPIVGKNVGGKGGN